MKKLWMALAFGLFAGLAHADTGDIPLSSNFQENSGRPLDARITVANATARLALTSVQVYNGMMVFQRSDSTNWQLQGSTFNWVNITSGGSGGSSVYPATATASFPFGLTATTGTFSSLTSGQVVYPTTGGLLTGSANFTTDGSSVTVSTMIVNSVATVLGPINAQDGIVMGASFGSNAGALDFWTSPSPTSVFYERLFMSNQNINSGPTLQRSKAGWNFEDANGNVYAYIQHNFGGWVINSTGTITLYDGPTTNFAAIASSNTNTSSYTLILPGGPAVSTNSFVNVAAINGGALNLSFFDLYDSSPTWTGLNTFTTVAGGGLTSCSGVSNAVTWNSGTNKFGCNTISSSGSGAAPFGVFNGSVLISSPTSGIVADGVTINAVLLGAATAQLSVNTSSITAQGNFYSLAGLAASTGTLTTSVAQLSFSTMTLGFAITNIAISTNTLETQVNTKINFSSITATQPAFWNSGTGVISVSGVSLSTGVIGQLPAASIAAGALGSGVIASSLTASGVTAGSYTNTNLTVNGEGQITAASNGSGGSGSGIVSPGTFTWTNNFGVGLSTLTLMNAAQLYTLLVTTATGGAHEVRVDSNGLVNFEAIISTPNAFTLKNPSGNIIFAVDNSSVSATDIVLTVSSVTSGGTPIATFQANGNVSIPELSSGQCVQTGSGGLLTGTGSACGSGGGGGSGGYAVQPATVTFNLTQGVIASTITVSTITVNGEIILQDGTVIKSTSTLGGGGGGSGTVNSAASNLNAYYASAGTAVSGDVNMQIWTSSETHTGSGGLGVTYNISSGSHTITQNSIGTTISSGVVLVNTTAAAAAAQQVSPSLELSGNGWKTNATAASQTVKWDVYTLPVQGSANATADLRFLSNISSTAQTPFDLCSVASGGAAPMIELDGQGCSGIGGSTGLGPVNAGQTFGAYSNGTDRMLFTVTGQQEPNTGKFGWGAGALSTAFNADTILARNNIGILEVDTSTVAGTWGQIITSTHTFYGPIISTGTAPTVSSCGSTPNGSVSGTNTAGVISVGGGITTACTLNFSGAGFPQAPVCVVSDNSTTVASSNGTITSTAATFNTSASLSGGLIYYICIGTRI